MSLVEVFADPPARAPRRVRSQAIAQTHQGPQWLRALRVRALALLLERVALGSSIKRNKRTSIIAPGREGSQLGVAGI